MKIQFFSQPDNCTIFSTGQGGPPPSSGSTGEGYSRAQSSEAFCCKDHECRSTFIIAMIAAAIFLFSFCIFIEQLFY
jgi:hypothetical protein